VCSGAAVASNFLNQWGFDIMPALPNPAICLNPDLMRLYQIVSG
jgi:hypothetical protein